MRLKLIPASTEGCHVIGKWLTSKWFYERFCARKHHLSLLTPSGPRLLPVPKVTVAASALREKRAKSLR